MPRRTGQILENLLIEDAGSEGNAIARYNDKVIFLRNVIPGDIADVLITKERSAYCMGKVIKIRKFSEKRTEAVCTHSGICGGCKWQNMKYEHQLFYKQKIVQDNLERIGKLDIKEFLPILPSPEVFHYRNKMEYSFSNIRFLTSEDGKPGEITENMNALGFHISPTFYKVLNIGECFLAPGISNNIRNHIYKYAIKHSLDFYDLREHKGYMRNMFTRHTSTGDCMVIMVFAEDNSKVHNALMDDLVRTFPEITSLMYVVNNKKNDIISDLPVFLYHGKDYIEENLDGIKFRIGPVSFFQTNSYQALNLYRIVKEFAGINKENIVYDLYTGTGTIANYIAKHAAKVVGIEYIPSAVSDAMYNSKLNNITNTSFYAGDMVEILNDEFISTNGRPDIIITDPPRAGMHKKVVEHILKVKPQKIVYVSCNSSTQARDAEILKESYRITKVRAIDMFPHTQHVENVMLLDCI